MDIELQNIRYTDLDESQSERQYQSNIAELTKWVDEDSNNRKGLLRVYETGDSLTITYIPTTTWASEKCYGLVRFFDILNLSGIQLIPICQTLRGHSYILNAVPGAEDLLSKQFYKRFKKTHNLI